MAENLPALLLSLSSSDADPAAEAALRDQIERLLSQLGDTERRVMELRLEGFTTAEVARRLGLDSDVLRVRLSRLRRRLPRSRCAERLAVIKRKGNKGGMRQTRIAWTKKCCHDSQRSTPTACARPAGPAVKRGEMMPTDGANLHRSAAICTELGSGTPQGSFRPGFPDLGSGALGLRPDH